VSVTPDRVAAPAQGDGSTADPQKQSSEVRDPDRRERPVFVIDDDAKVCESLVVLLEAYGFEAVVYASGTALLDDRRHREMGCLIIDHHMPRMDGIEVLAILRRKAIFVPTILIGGRLDASIAGRAAELGVIAVLEKPLAAARLIELVRFGLAKSS
jgi:two-component system response regulator FixJ